MATRTHHLYFHYHPIEDEDKLYEVEATVTILRDPNYGADLDGRRGVPAEFVEDIHILNVLDIDTATYIKLSVQEKYSIELYIEESLNELIEES